PAELAFGETRRQLVAQAERMPGVAAGLEKLFGKPGTARRGGHQDSATPRAGAVFSSVTTETSSALRPGSDGEGGEGLVPGPVDRDRELEAGDLQHPADLVVLGAEHQDAAVLAAVEVLPGTDDEGNPGGIDELALGKIDQQGAFVGL